MTGLPDGRGLSQPQRRDEEYVSKPLTPGFPIESTGHNVDLQPERMRLGSTAGSGNACGQVGDAWCLQFAYRAIDLRAQSR